MSIEREFTGDADLRAMAALACAHPGEHLHTVDLPYRFSSWALDDPANARLWVDRDGRPLAWAVLQTPFWTVDCACRDDADEGLFRQVLAWADRRAGQVLNTPHGRPCWFVNVFAGQAGRIRDLEAAGFANQAAVAVDAWSKVWMRHAGPGAAGAPPTGFTLRPLAGESEVDAYVELHCAVFGARNMSGAWRARTLRQPGYRPDLDLVAVAPDGRLAAFCVGWLRADEAGGRGQVEPLGVHADFRGRGLGRAILAEGLRRLYSAGARQVFVETDNYRDAAFALYSAGGFRVLHDVLVFRKDYAGQPGGR